MMSMTLEEDMGVEEELVFQQQHDAGECVPEHILSSPVSTQLARSLGMPSQRVQIMKASFFDSDMECATDATMGTSPNLAIIN